MENYLSQIKNIVSEFQTNKVYILGKGPSSGKINPRTFRDGIVININDSERIYPGHFCLVHSLWAHESIQSNGSRAKCYFSSRKLDEESNWYRLNYQPETFETSEKIISLMEESNLSIYDFLFISATKLALKIQEIWAKKAEVYFIGFDFNNNQSKIITDYSSHLPEYTEIILKMQESVFLTMKKYFKKSLILNLIHVGDRTFSDIESINKVRVAYTLDESVEFNNQLYKNLIQGVDKGKPIIVAELTNNHAGDEHRLKAMIRLAKDAGANAVKVQKRDVETFYTDSELKSAYESPFGNTLKDYRTGVELDDYLFKVLTEECFKNQIFWFLSILDYKSFKYVEKYNLPLIKLPSTISEHKNFLLRVGKEFSGDLVVSTGFTDVEYENFILDNFTEGRKLFILQCTSSYPAPPEACQIAVVRHYNNLRESNYQNLIPGYSSHDIGSISSMMSLSAGGLMVEKHVKLGNLDWIHFDGVALDLANNQFRDFVKDIKLGEVMCGEKEKEIHSFEHHKYLPNDVCN